MGDDPNVGVDDIRGLLTFALIYKQRSMTARNWWNNSSRCMTHPSQGALQVTWAFHSSKYHGLGVTATSRQVERVWSGTPTLVSTKHRLITRRSDLETYTDTLDFCFDA